MPRWQIEGSSGRIALTGELRTADATAIWRSLRQQLGRLGRGVAIDKLTGEGAEAAEGVRRVPARLDGDHGLAASVHHASDAVARGEAAVIRPAGGNAIDAVVVAIGHALTAASDEVADHVVAAACGHRERRAVMAGPVGMSNARECDGGAPWSR